MNRKKLKQEIEIKLLNMKGRFTYRGPVGR